MLFQTKSWTVMYMQKEHMQRTSKEKSDASIQYFRKKIRLDIRYILLLCMLWCSRYEGLYRYHIPAPLSPRLILIALSICSSRYLSAVPSFSDTILVLSITLICSSRIQDLFDRKDASTGTCVGRFLFIFDDIGATISVGENLLPISF